MMMINNGASFFPPPPSYGSIPVICCEQWTGAVQQNMPSAYYNSNYQQQRTHQQMTNGQSSTLVKLYDFDGNNSSEIIRLLFTYAGVTFRDKRVKQDEWERVKVRMPIQKLPMLRVNNQLKIYSLNPITRYLARGFQLYGTGPDDQAIVDMILELNLEFQEKLFEQMNISTDAEQGKILLTQFLTDHGINHFNQMEKLYQTFNRSGPFYLGAQISLADLIVYQTINYFLGLQPKLLDNYSHLQQTHQQLEKHPQLSNYSRKKNVKHKKKRHATVPPTPRHSDHHQRHRSHDEPQSSRQPRSREESSPSSEIKQESKEDPSERPSQTRQKSKSPDITSTAIVSEEKSERPSQTRQKSKSPDITSTAIVSEEKSELVNN